MAAAAKDPGRKRRYAAAEEKTQDSFGASDHMGRHLCTCADPPVNNEGGSGTAESASLEKILTEAMNRTFTCRMAEVLEQNGDRLPSFQYDDDHGQSSGDIL